MKSSHWRHLLDIAVRQIDFANENGARIDHWTLGGGTALMLHLQHRVSHDIDIFLSNPQSLGFLDPGLWDFPPGLEPVEFTGDQAVWVKHVFGPVGEIDYIVAPPVSDQHFSNLQLSGVSVRVETVWEIVGKKIRYRGASLAVRDVFDLAASFHLLGPPVFAEMSGVTLKNVEDASDRLSCIAPDYFDTVVGQLNRLAGFSMAPDEQRALVMKMLAAWRDELRINGTT